MCYVLYGQVSLNQSTPSIKQMSRVAGYPATRLKHMQLSEFRPALVLLFGNAFAIIVHEQMKYIFGRIL